MSTAKQKMTELIQSQPDDASYEEILKELAFERMVNRGLDDSRQGGTVSNDQVEQQLHSWRK